MPESKYMPERENTSDKSLLGGYEPPTDPMHPHACTACDHRGIRRSGRLGSVYCTCPLGRERQRLHLLRNEKLFDHAGIPTHLKHVTLDSLRAVDDLTGKEDAVEAVASITETGTVTCPVTGHVRRSLCLFGRPGIGKSGLLVVVARDVYRKGFVPLWIKYLDLVKSVQAGYGQHIDFDGPELSTLRIQAAQQASVLFLDDLGDPYASEHAGRGAGRSAYAGTPARGESKDRRDIAFQVLSARHERQRPTFISANYQSLDGAYRQFDPRFADRIKEMCALVTMSGKNLRGDTRSDSQRDTRTKTKVNHA